MTCSLPEKIAEAKGRCDEQFAACLLDTDPLIGKLKAAERSVCIAGSLQCGCEAAQSLRCEYGEQTPVAIAEKLKLKVVESALPAARTVLSSFDPVAGVITLNKDLFGMIDLVLARHGLEDLFGPVKPVDVAVAHELFHYMESRDKRLFTKRFTFTLWRLGPFSYTSSIPAASEIGAMSCAKSLCRLAVNPLLLDLVIMEGLNGAEK